MGKVIGILGGMGPLATIDLIAKVYRLSAVEREQEHPRVLVDIDPSIPDRTRALLENRQGEIVQHLAANAHGLLAQGADVLAIACNTAHAFLPQLRRQVKGYFADMVAITVQHILARGHKRVGVLATDGTLAARLYIDQLAAVDVDVLLPDPGHQHQLMEAIYAFKTGATGKGDVAQIYRELQSRGAEAVVAACTELPLLLPSDPDIVDPALLLARHLLALAREG